MTSKRRSHSLLETQKDLKTNPVTILPALHSFGKVRLPRPPARPFSPVTCTWPWPLVENFYSQSITFLPVMEGHFLSTLSFPSTRGPNACLKFFKHCTTEREGAGGTGCIVNLRVLGPPSPGATAAYVNLFCCPLEVSSFPPDVPSFFSRRCRILRR